MNNPTRIELLRALESLSETYPEWRFGQMIANLALVAKGTSEGAIWDMDDHELLTAIRWQLEQHRDQPSIVN